MHKNASAEERAAKTLETTVHHFGFTKKVYGLPYTVRTFLLWKRRHRNAIVGMSFFKIVFRNFRVLYGFMYVSIHIFS